MRQWTVLAVSKLPGSAFIFPHIPPQPKGSFVCPCLLKFPSLWRYFCCWGLWGKVSSGKDWQGSSSFEFCLSPHVQLTQGWLQAQTAQAASWRPFNQAHPTFSSHPVITLNPSKCKFTSKYSAGESNSSFLPFNPWHSFSIISKNICWDTALALDTKARCCLWGALHLCGQSNYAAISSTGIILKMLLG